MLIGIIKDQGNIVEIKVNSPENQKGRDLLKETKKVVADHTEENPEGKVRKVEETIRKQKIEIWTENYVITG